MVLVYLGLEFDMIKMKIRLPAGKLSRIRQLIAEWRSRTLCSVNQLESLIGELQRVCFTLACAVFVQAF